jgi:hypothetical protein
MKKKVSVFVFCFILSANIFSQEYRISAIRTYHIYDDLKYLQTVETYNYSENNLLLKKTVYRFHPEDGFSLRRETIFSYNESNTLLKEEYSDGSGDITSKHYEYDDDDRLNRTYFEDNNGLMLLSSVLFIYEDEKIIEKGLNYTTTYDQNWNLLLEEQYNWLKQISDRYNKYYYEDNRLSKIEHYRIFDEQEELTQIKHFTYNDYNQLLSTETLEKRDDEFLWQSNEIYTYNSIGEISTITSDFNYDFDPVYFEVYSQERIDLIEYEYQTVE